MDSEHSEDKTRTREAYGESLHRTNVAGNGT